MSRKMNTYLVVNLESTSSHLSQVFNYKTHYLRKGYIKNFLKYASIYNNKNYVFHFKHLCDS